jgi:hypothetical protein
VASQGSLRWDQQTDLVVVAQGPDADPRLLGQLAGRPKRALVDLANLGHYAALGSRPYAFTARLMPPDLHVRIRETGCEVT